MIRRSKHSQNYTVIPNEILEHIDDALAIGLLVYLLSKPANWNVTKQQLYKHFRQGRQSLDKSFKLLEKIGYINGEQQTDEGGRFKGHHWIVSDVPDQLHVHVFMDNQVTENRQPSTDQLISTIEVSTIEQSKEENNIDFDLLLSYLNTTLGKKHKLIPGSIRDKYKARIKEGFTQEDIHQAIKIASMDDYHQGTTPKNKHLTPEFFSRPDKLDKFLSQAPTTEDINEYNPRA